MSKVRFLSISDLHGGTYNTNITAMYKYWETYLYPQLSEIDILFIVGDVFDKGMAYDSSASQVLTRFIIDICYMANDFGFLIRVVRGTYSHDRNSSVMIQIVGNHICDKGQVRYFDTVEIEHIEKFNKSILYVPDDLPYNDAQERVIELIKSTSKGSVDILAFHGMCKHQLPYGIPKPPLNTIDMKKWVKYVNDIIITGHVHQKSIFIPNKTKNTPVVCNGSFDRIAHGEEEAKGCYLITIEDGKNPVIKFIHNKEAHVFKTIYFIEVDTEKSITSLDETVDVLTNNRKYNAALINIRIIINDPIQKAAVQKYCLTHFKHMNIRFTFKSEKEDLFEDVEEDVEEEKESIIATPETLPLIIFERGGGIISKDRITSILQKYKLK
ncbi:MAG: hypothetical protein GY804_09235 [Alphaproteobacteria bacterium]|nr:hypothetical protein [Alphaproteobacteria bacterium]